MSTEPANPTKPQPKPEKTTDATAVLSPDELRAIAGGATGSLPPPLSKALLAYLHATAPREPTHHLDDALSKGSVNHS